MIRFLLTLSSGLMLWLAYMAFNLTYLSHFLDHDVVAYLEHTRKHFFFNPHHLLFTIYGRAIVLFSASWWNHSPLFLFQLVHLGLAGATSLLCAVALYHRSGSWVYALAAVAPLPFLRGFWSYSHIYDTPIVPVCLSLLTFLWISESSWTWGKKAIVAGGLMALTLAFHQKHFLLFLPAALLFLRTTGPGRLPAVFLFASTTLFLIAGLYFYAGAIHHGYPLSGKSYLPGVERGGDFFDWIFLYSHYNNSWGSRFDLQAGWLGFVQAIVATRKKTFQTEDVEFLILTVLAATAFVALILTVLRRNYVALLAGLWFLLEVVLALWWEPIFFEHWVSVTAILWLFAALGICPERDSKRGNRPTLLTGSGRPLRQLLAALPFLFCALLLLGWNFEQAIKPASQAIHFGHWEDFYVKSRYAGLWNSIYREPVPTRMEHPDQARNKRLAILATLRVNLLAGKESFGTGAWRFEKTLQALRDVAPDEPTLAGLEAELSALRAGREAYFSFHGRSAESSEP